MKTLPLQIMENVLVIGFTLLVVPPSYTSAKVLSEFPSLEGLLPWAETSVAVEHFVADQGSDGTVADQSNQFTVPLMEISLSAGGEHKKRKPTVASLTIAVEEVIAW